ncbi:MAG: GNAT family N-acetyltransferase, partial [Anaerolineales bacterium]|nr:GNAT family N-acetyltransferase [Anaerolineales bacterium]
LAEPTIFPKLPGALFFNSMTPAWQGWLAGLVAGRQIIPMPRRLYQAEAGLVVGDVALPAGYQLHFMDETIRCQIAGELPGDVSNVLKLRQGQDRPDGAAFGFAVIHDGECVAQAMVDYIVGDRGEIGLFTAPSHRQKRLGEATAAATIRYGLAHGLRLIDWDCTAFNVGSRRLAEKLGLRLTAEYTQGWLIFSEVSYLVNWGFYAVDTGRYAEALAWCEQTLAVEHELALPYGHYLAGVARAGLGETEAALTHLKAAAEAGFDELAELTERAELKSLHDQAAWPALLTRVGQNLG